MEHRSRSYWPWALIFLAFLVVCGLVLSVGTGLPSSVPSITGIIPLERLNRAIPAFAHDFLEWFPQLSLKYVLIPVLIELIFTIPLAVFFYREFVRIDAGPSLDTSATRPRQYRWLVVCGIAVSAIILLFLADILYSFRVHVTRQLRLPATQARTMGFMFLVVMNPIMYQLIAGLRMALRFRRFRFRRFRAILITVVIVAPVSYALLLTACFCCFEENYWQLAAPMILYDAQPPELALWITGLNGLVFMWCSIWLSKKFMIDRQTDPVPAD